MIRNRSVSWGLGLVVFVAASATAGSMHPVARPTPPATNVLELVSEEGTTHLNLREIEQLGLYRVRTPTPWESGINTFEGVLFRDFLAHVDHAEVDEVTLQGFDGYTQFIPRADWENGPLLLATRGDGTLLSRREKGPLRLVYPLLDHPEYDKPENASKWVWLIQRIVVSEPRPPAD